VSDDGSRLFLVAVNKHFTQPARLTIRLNGFTPDGAGTVRVLTGPSLDAHNGDDLPRGIPGLDWAKQIGAPRRPMIEEGRPGLVATKESTLAGVDSTFTYVCPPMSANALELRRRPAAQ
jgi:hypothetical protein